jgi:hypothetical protein
LYIGGERKEGVVRKIERKRPKGVWEFSTCKTLSSYDLIEHAMLLLETLEPVMEVLTELKKNAKLFSRISIRHVGSGSFEFPFCIMNRMTLLCDEIIFSSWEVDE